MSAPAPWRATLAGAMAAMESTREPHHVALTHGTMRVLAYAPRGVDDQTPHRKDEVYIVHAGHARFIRDGVESAVAAGDVLFVPAGMEHRFIAMSDDFLMPEVGPAWCSGAPKAAKPERSEDADRPEAAL